MSLIIVIAAVLTIILMYAAAALFFATLADEQAERTKAQNAADLYSPYWRHQG
ncbi:MAG: hypothetical protein AAGK33_13265 [Pseudomonadota bacterium]